MTDFNTGERVKRMIQAINQESKEKSEQISENGRQMFIIEKNKLLTFQREKTQQEYNQKMEKYVVDQRIKNSSRINESRIQKMKSRFEMIEKLKSELRTKLTDYVNDSSRYQSFMRKLLVETLLSTMEEQVQLIVREKDVNMVQGLLADVQQEYAQKVLDECKRKINPNVTVHKKRYLEQTHRNCIGGVLLTALSNRITVDNTLEARVELAFQQFLPDIRSGLFPEYK